MTIEEHAEMILQAAGTSLRHYTMCKWRDAILAAVRAVYEDGRETALRAQAAEIALLKQPILYQQPIGSTMEEWRANVYQTDLYHRGDTVLVWINEGSIYLPPFVRATPPEIPHATAATPALSLCAAALKARKAQP